MPTFTKTVTMSGNSNYSITFTVTEALPSDYIQTNKTNVDYTLTVTKSAGSGYWDYNEENPVVVSINGSTIVNTNISYDFRNSTPKTITLASGTVTGIAHNSDGTKTIAVSGSFTDNGNYLGSATASGNLTLTTIPRQTTITSFTVSKRNETSLTFNWATADTVDYVWYSTNNGSSWSGYDVTDGTSGSFNVTGLSPNTTYNCKLRVRRKDSQMTTDSSSVSQTTYKVPTQSLNTKTEVSIKMNWSIDTTADYIWYSTNNGSSWTAVGGVNATSGNYTISGLSASTTYNVKTRVRRSATQTTYDTSSLNITTSSYPDFATQPTYSARTETTLDIYFRPNMPVALAQYRIKPINGNYGNWVNIDSNNIIEGFVSPNRICVFRISSLTANTNYAVQLRLKSTLTDHYTNSNEETSKMYTYAYPYCTESPNFTISNSGVTLKFYNPLSRTISINIIGNGTQLAYTWGTTGTSKVVFDGSTTQSQLYATIPNKTSATYQVKVTYDGHVSTRSNNNTYTINVNDCKPIFNDFSYSTNYSGLTGNNATIINGETTTTFTISTSNKATGKNSATITKYRLECGTQTKDVTYSSSASVSDIIANCTNQIIKVSAIDSRGLETSVSKTVTNFVNYSKPSFRDITTNRDDGVETTTKLNFRVNYWDGSFGSLSNTIISVQYRSKLTTASSYGSYTTIPVSSLTLSNGIARLEDYLIHANGSSGGFEVGKAYNVEVKVVDGNGSTTLETATTTSNITDGNVAFSTFQDSEGQYHIGFNGMPSTATRFAVDGEPLYDDIIISSSKPTTGEKVWIQKGNNLFEPTFRQGRTTGYAETRVFSTSVLYLKAGTYTISGDFDTSTYELNVMISPVVFPYVSGSFQLIYDSPWITSQSFTFTFNQDGYFGLNIRKKGDVAISISDISSYNFMLNIGNSALPYENYVSKNENINNNGSYEIFNNVDSGGIVRGKTSTGEYIKFPNGTLICTKTLTANTTIANQWGSMYESSAISIGEFAHPFIEVPDSISAVCSFGNACFVELIMETTATHWGKTYLARPSKTSDSRMYKISLTAIGRWK